MVIYSVEILIDEAVADAWMRWMKESHIPAVLATGYFLDCQFGRVMEPHSVDGHVGFRIDYRCRSVTQLEEYQRDSAAALQADHASRFSGRFEATRRVIALVDDRDEP